MERNYEFRKRLSEVHKPGRKNPEVYLKKEGVVVTDDWQIVYPDDADRVIKIAANDLREYFEVSLEVYPTVRPASLAQKTKIIEYNTLYNGKKSSYKLTVEDDKITISGADSRGAAQGSYFIEDQMNLNEGPVIAKGVTEKEPIYSPRMIHSGYGLDMFPDEHLRTIAHHGMDAILVFTKDVHITPYGFLDFNDLIYRAAGYGIDVYAYSYHKNYRHPSDPHAKEDYRKTYGRLFKECPGLKGIVFVGESCDFPSKDPNTCGVPAHMARTDLQYKATWFSRPYPGWYPCNDYGEFMTLIRDVIWEENPEADIVLWTYNWGNKPKEARLELIRSLPEGITLQATYEMFELFPIEGGMERLSDYSISFAGPGQYFASEAEEAKKCGVKLYTMSNTGGLTWDVGVIPYVPVPYQWKDRWDSMQKAHDDWGLCGLMESHHYGFYPSFVSELHKATCWSPVDDFDTHIRAIAVRDFGEENADKVLDAWKYMSDGIRKYVSTDEDQYGPFRIGPAYPLLLLDDTVIPSPDFAHFKNNYICHPMYNFDITKMARLNYEINSISEMRELFKKGADIFEEILPSIPANRLDDAKRMYGLARFIENSAKTTVNVKKWHILKHKLGFKPTMHIIGPAKNDFVLNEEIFDAIPVKERNAIILEMKAIAEAEIENAKATIPLVDFDSRLGWEPSMEYMCDREHLEWKIKHVEKSVGSLMRYYDPHADN